MKGLDNRIQIGALIKSAFINVLVELEKKMSIRSMLGVKVNGAHVVSLGVRKEELNV
jgi:hypothetical protein